MGDITPHLQATGGPSADTAGRRRTNRRDFTDALGGAAGEAWQHG